MSPDGERVAGNRDGEGNKIPEITKKTRGERMGGIHLRLQRNTEMEDT